jgi:hypothetical protein
MLSSKVIEAEAYGKKTAKIKCKKRYRFKKATLYEREVIKKQKFFYSLAEASILIQHVVRQSYSLKLWCLRVFQASSVIEILINV